MGEINANIEKKPIYLAIFPIAHIQQSSTKPQINPLTTVISLQIQCD